jgi:hypothetical protein
VKKSVGPRFKVNGEVLQGCRLLRKRIPLISTLAAASSKTSIMARFQSFRPQ